MTDLTEIFGRTDVDTVDLFAAPPLLMKQIADGGKVLYEKTMSVFNEFYLYALRMREDARVLSDLRRSSLDHKIREYAHA